MRSYQTQVRMSQATKEALGKLLAGRQAGNRINEIAAQLTALEVNKLLAEEPRSPVGYATLNIIPTPDVLLNAERLYLDIKRLLRAAACKAALD